MSTISLNTPLVWVEDWPVLYFFYESFANDEELQSNEEKMELLWTLVQKLLLAKEAQELEIKIDKNIFQKELEILKNSAEIKNALNSEINEKDLNFFLDVEKKSAAYVNYIKETIKKDLKENPSKINEIYDNHPDLLVKNAYVIMEAWTKNKLKGSDTEKIYTEKQLKDLGFTLKKLGVFSEKELNDFYPQDLDPIVGKKEGALIPIDLKGIEHLYYFIIEKHDSYRKKFEDIKQELEEFIVNYTLQENLDEIYQNLMDKYTIRYNEESLNQILSES